RTPQAPALDFFGRTFSYGQLSELAARLARAFKDQGLRPGERLAILLPNCPQFVVAYHAALRLGAVVVPLNPLLSARELAHQLNDSGTRRLVVLDHLLPKVEEARGKLDLNHLIVTSLPDALPWPLSWLYTFKARRQGLARGFKPAPGRFGWRGLLAQPPLWDEPIPGVQDLAVLLYTGGTTGTPKAAMLSHGNLMANVAQISAWLPQVRFGGERLVAVLPMAHSFGLTACLNWPMSQGAQIIVLPRFEIDGFMKMLRKCRPTMLPGVPTIFVALINDPRLPALDLSSLWACISGSAPLPLEVRDRFESLSGCRIMEGYGLTEAGPVTHLNPVQGPGPPGDEGLLAKPRGDRGGPAEWLALYRRPGAVGRGWLFLYSGTQKGFDHFRGLQHLSPGSGRGPLPVSGGARGGGLRGAGQLSGRGRQGGHRAPGRRGAERPGAPGFLRPATGPVQGAQVHRVPRRTAQEPGGQNP